MPQVTFAPAAIRDLQRLLDFLRPEQQQYAARRAGEGDPQGVRILGAHPLDLGRMVDDLPEEFREWLSTLATAATSFGIALTAML